MEISFKFKIIIAFLLGLSLFYYFPIEKNFAYAKCGDGVWNVGEDVNNCPQDANEYSVSPPAQLNIPDTLGNTVGMYIFPDWHKPTQADLKTQWSSIMNATSSYDVLQEQPKKPLLNYYDDTNPIVARWTIKWALERGVNLFVYDWYDWSYTEEPINITLNELNNYYAPYKDKAKFALMWANHDMPTSTDKILAKLDRAATKYFWQSQYFKIDNQPVFMIFDINGFIDNFGMSGANDLLTQMKNNMKAKGYNGLYIVFRGDCNRLPTTQPLALDAMTTYNYSDLMKMPIDTYDNFIQKYSQTWESVYSGCQSRKNLAGQPINYFVPVTTGWDNTVWKGLYGFSMYISAIVGGTPDKFQTMLQNAKAFIEQKNIQPKVVLINAWNEWGEGSVLEPRADKWGFGYLEAVKNVFSFKAVDTVPPTISSISTFNITPFAATVTWATNEPADGQLEFGTTACPCANKTPIVPDMLTSHIINLSNLVPSTTYYYRVKSKDASGNLSVSPNYNFKTLAISTATIQIDVQKEIGEMPYIFRSGTFETGQVSKYQQDYFKSKYFNEHLPGVTTISMPFWSFNSEADFKQKVEIDGVFLPAINDAKEVLKGGGRVLFDFSTMPLWLSSNAASSEFFRYPPKDYGQWQQFISYMVDYIHNKQGVKDADYRIWEEADLGMGNKPFWNGTAEEFYKLYHYSVNGIRAIDLDAKITFGNAVIQSDMMRGMINYAAQNNLPLDYIIFHPFKTAPYQFSYQKAIQNVQGWLASAGLPVSTPFHAESWNSWLDTFKKFPSGEANENSAERDTEYNAAYTIQTLLAQELGGVKYHSFFSRSDFSYLKTRNSGSINPIQQFFGDFGLFTGDFIIKPVYNSFRILSLLSGKGEAQITNRLEVSQLDDFVSVIAAKTKDQKKIKALVSNFIPAQPHQKPYLIDKFKKYPSIQATQIYTEQLLACVEKGGTATSVKACADAVIASVSDVVIKERVSAQADLFMCIDYFNNDIGQCINEAISKTTDAMFKQDLISLQNLYNSILNYQVNPRTIDLLIKNMPFSGKVSVTTYLVDNTHANSCKYNKVTELVTTNTECGADGSVDRQVEQAKNEAKDKASSEVYSYLKSKNYSDAQAQAVVDNVINACEDNDQFTKCASAASLKLCPSALFSDCVSFQADITSALPVYLDAMNNLLYYGKYINLFGQTLTISKSVDAINNMPEVSLEGSKKIEEMQILSNGEFSKQLTLQPYAVMLLEITGAAITDITPPAISSVSTSNITPFTASITWTTNEPADGQLEFGTTACPCANKTPIVPDMLTAHVINLSNLAPATTYYYRVSSKDASGNLSVSSSYSFKTTTAKDANIPTVPANFTAVPYSSTQIDLSWSPSTDNLAVTGYTIYRNGTKLTTTTATSYSNKYLSANTNYTYAVDAYDASGNHSAQTDPIIVKTPDPSAPKISSVAAKNITPSSASITWLTNESTDGQLEFGTTACPCLNFTPIVPEMLNSHIIDLFGLNPNTTYHYRVRSRDASGNLSVSRKYYFKTLDDVPPAVVLVSPANDATVANIAAISASASDNAGVSKVEFYRDGDILIGTDTRSPFKLSWNSKTTANGAHTIYSKAYDKAGNSAVSASVSIIVINISDAILPRVSIAKPRRNALTGGDITVSASASDNGGVERVEFYKDSDMVPFASDLLYPFNALLDTKILSDGLHTVSAKVYDGAGNSASSSAVTFTVDNEPPAVSLVAPADNATLSGKVVFSAYASDSSGISKVEFYRDADIRIGRDYKDPYTYTLNTKYLTVGAHTFFAKTYDKAGNVFASQPITTIIAR